MGRCGRHGEGEAVALREGLVGIGRSAAPDLDKADSSEQVSATLHAGYQRGRPGADHDARARKANARSSFSSFHSMRRPIAWPMSLRGAEISPVVKPRA